MSFVTLAQYPPARKDAVVAPPLAQLWPEDLEATVVDKKASPQPPPGAVVESPAKSQYTGFAAVSAKSTGAAKVRGKMESIENRMFVKSAERLNDRIVQLEVLFGRCRYYYILHELYDQRRERKWH